MELFLVIQPFLTKDFKTIKLMLGLHERVYVKHLSRVLLIKNGLSVDTPESHSRPLALGKGP